MQYHLDGFRAGDPSVAPATQKARSDYVDVLIVGCGPAGLTLATQLSAFGDISTRIIERKAGPLEFGHASVGASELEGEVGLALLRLDRKVTVHTGNKFIFSQL